MDTHTAGFDTLDWNEKRPLTDAQIDFHFEEFWKHCPRAVAKAKAQAIYRKVVRSGKASIDKLLHAMMQYAAARDEADQDEYTKSPATWLEEGCWDDDPAAHALGSGRHRFSRLWQKMKAVVSIFRQRPGHGRLPSRSQLLLILGGAKSKMTLLPNSTK